MKRLLLALLVSVTAVLAAGQAPEVSADCVQRTFYFYEYPGGPLCGFRHAFCESGSYASGCLTPYYTTMTGCGCR